MAMHSIQVLAIYGGIVVAFLGGMIWGWMIRKLHQNFVRNDSLYCLGSISLLVSADSLILLIFLYKFF